MRTVFIRILEAPPDEKPDALRSAIRNGDCRFDGAVSDFAQVPRTPFAYWVNAGLRSAFSKLPPFESEDRTARQGLATADDFRFVRLTVEISHRERNTRWFPFAKGGKYSIFYADIPVVVNWASDGRELRNFYRPGSSKLASRPQNVDFYFRPGMTWPLRTSSFCPQALPAGAICSVRGYGAYADAATLPAMLGVCSSSAFDFFFKMALGRFGHPEFVIGTLQGLPWPKLISRQAEEIAQLVVDSWRVKRTADSNAEMSHAFLLPVLASGASTFMHRAALHAEQLGALEERATKSQQRIDALVADAYGIHISAIEQVGAPIDEDGEAIAESEDDFESNGGEDAGTEVDAAPMVGSLLSWAMGVAFGRFDVRLATGDRYAPPEPEPFDPLPVCSPGMLTGDDGLPVAAPPSGYPLTFPPDGILVDDPGHPRDVVRAARAVFDAVFDDANARWHEAAELVGAPELRTWFARDFFEPHIKRYSKSRRKAPIYWQLATASGSYSVWLYIHRATGDTYFRVLNDFVGPKLDHEKAKLDGLSREAGANPSAAQRREIERQEAFVGELQALKTEVARVAPLWKPNLHDGVILNFAPLWRLVPQSRSWQAECKKAWDKLVAGDYDWAHLAMHLWPERVVPKCIDDRSLAIAHGLEDLFWHEDDSGTWSKSRVDDATMEKLIQERTSTTVKAALKDLLSAATPTASKGRKAKGRSESPRASALKPAPAARWATAPDSAIDEATLRAVKAAIASVADGASKADVLTITGLSEGDWNTAIAALLERGDVTRTGQKRDTRYHADSPREDE